MGRWIPLDYWVDCPHINEKVTMKILSSHIIGTDSYALRNVIDASCGIYESCPAKDEKGNCLGFLEVRQRMEKLYEESL